MALRQDEIVISYKVEGAGSIDGARAAFDKLTVAEKDAIEQAKKLGKETEKSTNQVKGNVESSTQSVKKFGGALDGIKGQLLAAFSVGAIVAFGKQLLDVTAKMEQYQKRINFASGSASEGAIVTQYLTDLTKKYGLELETVIRTYSSFAAASKASNMNQSDTTKIFEGVTKAVAAFGLSSEQAEGVFLALTQMISKGTVQAEELRGQLGERLPGSFAIAARSIGVTEQALGKMLEQGQVISRDFLPKFAAELEKTFGEEALKNINTQTGALQRFNTELTLSFQTMAKTSMISGAYQGVLKGLTWALEAYNGVNKTTEERMVAVQTEADRLYKEKLTSGKDVLADLNVEYDRLNARLKEVKTEQEELGKVTNFNNKQWIEDAKLSQVREKAILRSIQLVKSLMEQYKPVKEVVNNQKELNKAYQDAIKLQQLLEDLQIRRKKLELSIGANEAEQALNEGAIINIKKKSTEEKLEIDRKYADLEVQIAKDALAGRLLSIEEFNKDALKLEYNRVVGIAELEKKANADMRQIMADRQKKEKTDVTSSLSLAKAKQKIAEDEVDETTKARNKALQEQAQTREQAINREIMNLGNVLADGVSNLVSNAIKKPIQEEYNATVALYEQQMQLFEGNLEMQAAARDRFEAKERELKKRAFNADKQAAIANAIFQATPNIVKLLTFPPTIPAGIIASAALAAQIAFIAAQPMPAFAKGTEYVEGAGTGTSDSIMARLSKGERVMTARQNKPLLDMGIKNDDIPKIVLDYMSLTSGRTKGSNSRGIERKLDDLNRSIKSLPVAAISLDGKGFSKSIRSGNRTSVILNNQFVN
jgi:tape measure domain-containing protein